jgi:hypothetical protein
MDESNSFCNTSNMPFDIFFVATHPFPGVCRAQILQKIKHNPPHMDL